MNDHHWRNYFWYAHPISITKYVYSYIKDTTYLCQIIRPTVEDLPRGSDDGMRHDGSCMIVRRGNYETLKFGLFDFSCSKYLRGLLAAEYHASCETTIAIL